MLLLYDANSTQAPNPCATRLTTNLEDGLEVKVGVDLVWWRQGVRLRLDKWMRALGVHCGDVIAVICATCGCSGGCKQLKYSPLASWTTVCHGLNGREEGEGRMLLCRSWQLMQVQDMLRTGRGVRNKVKAWAVRLRRLRTVQHGTKVLHAGPAQVCGDAVAFYTQPGLDFTAKL